MSGRNSIPRSLKVQHPKEYNTWKGMRARCHNPKATSYRYYGAKGVVVCDRWRDDFAAFLSDVGQAPSPAHQLGRQDNGRGYEPGNVAWETPAEQQRNTSKVRWLTHDGRTLCLADWAKETGLPMTTISHRLCSLGWDAARALTTPSAPSRRKPTELATETSLPERKTAITTRAD